MLNHDSAKAQSAAQTITQQIRVLESFLQGKPLAEKVEIGSLLWDLRDLVSDTLDKIKDELRDEALSKLKRNPGIENFQGSFSGSCSVTVPKPSTRIVKGTDMSTLRTMLGDDFSLFFEETVSYKPRREFEERVAALEDPLHQQVLIKSIEHKDNTPRVSFRRNLPVEVSLEEGGKGASVSVAPSTLDDILE